MVSTALLSCSMGVAPASMNVLPINRVMIEGQPAATIMDFVPFLNITPFGMCMSLANPATAGLTAAALGVLTPGPCTPMTSSPWTPGAAKTMIAGFPALTDSSQCICAYGGAVTVSFGGAVKTQVG